MKVYPIYIDYPLENIVRDTYDCIYDKIREGLKECINEDSEKVQDLDFSIEKSEYDEMVDELLLHDAKAVMKISDNHEVSFTGSIKDGNKTIPVKKLEELLDKISIQATYKLVTVTYPAHMSEYDIRYGMPEPADWDYEDEKLEYEAGDITNLYFNDMIELPDEQQLINYLEQEEQKDVSDFVR